MTTEGRKDLRFYSCLILAYILMIISLFLPPVGIIATSVLYAAIIILSIAALSIGIDVSNILKEVNELKRLSLEEAKLTSENK